MATEKFLALYVKEEKRPLLEFLASDMYRFIEKEKDVPYLVVHTFLNLFIDPAKLDENDIAENANLVTTKILKRLSGRNDLPHTKIIDNGVQHLAAPLLHSLSFSDFMYQLMHSFLSSQHRLGPASKDDTIGFWYHHLKSHNGLYDSKENPLTRNKKRLITAIIVQEMGYSISSKKNLTNDEISDSVRNAISKYEKEMR
jgi:hypothetical protein